MINILIIDDHPLFIEGVEASLKLVKEKIDIVGTAGSVKEAMLKLENVEVDVVLLDLLMPEMNGAKGCRLIKDKFPETKVIALTGELDTLLLYDAWMNDVDAIILKYSERKQLLNAIDQVMAGKRVIGDDVPFFLSPENDKLRNSNPKLTRREEEVLTELAKGLTRKETSECLFISIESVNFHCRNIFRKFDKSNLHQVLTEAKRLRIIS